MGESVIDSFRFGDSFRISELYELILLLGSFFLVSVFLLRFFHLVLRASLFLGLFFKSICSLDCESLST